MTGAAAIPDGSVVITPTEMYREMLATHQAVQTVGSKLDSALDSHGRRLDEHDRLGADHEARIRVVETHATASADHETRLSAVEKRVWMAAGASALLSAAAAAAATLLAGTGR